MKLKDYINIDSPILNTVQLGRSIAIELKDGTVLYVLPPKAKRIRKSRAKNQPKVGDTAMFFYKGVKDNHWLFREVKITKINDDSFEGIDLQKTSKDNYRRFLFSRVKDQSVVIDTKFIRLPL